METRTSTAFENLTGREIIEKREANVKHFDLGQGRRQAVVFASPVHFKNEKSGAWEEIDNRLVEKTDAKGRRRFENKSGAFRARFFEDADAGSLASMKSGDTEFSWSYPGARVSKPAHTKKALRRKFDSELSRRMKVIDRLSDDVLYESLFPGMSVRLTVDDLGVKEDIILENAAALSHAVLALPAGFDYVKNADNSVSVLKGGAEKLRIDAPYTYDAGMNSIPTSVSLTSSGANTLLRYDISSSDLEAASFPVTIDPRVAFTGQNSAIVTSCIHNRKKDEPGHTATYLTTGCGGTSPSIYTYITLCQFNELVEKKASDTILSAQLYMRVAGYASSYKFVCAYPMLKPWEVTTATWNSIQADTNTYISDRIQSFVTRTDTTHCVFDITDLYKTWYEKDEAGNSKNYGVALARPREYSGYDYTVFYSSNASDSSKKPYVVVDYVSHAGVKDWWTYENLSCGRAGSANIDLFNGNLVAHHADTATVGSRMPVSVQHVYNSCQSLSDDFGCGLGWRTNLHQTIRTEKIASADYYIWQDGEGTDHYFTKTTSQPYTDCEGMQLKMNATTEGTGENETLVSATITDKGDNVMTFEKTADVVRLMSVADPHGNTMSLSYNEAGKLIEVEDGMRAENTRGRLTTFAYNNNGLLSSVTAPGCPVVQYEYAPVTGGYNLHKVVYSDLSSENGAVNYSEYAYDGSMLTSMKNFDGCELAVSYESNLNAAIIDAYTEQSRRVTEIEFKNGNVKGAKKKFIYGHMRTDVMHMENDTNGKKITYHFNSSGNVVDVNDEMWYTYGTKYDSGIENSPSDQGRVRKAVVNRIKNSDFYTGWTQTKGNAADVFSLDETNLCMSIRGAKMVKGGEGESVFATTAKLFETGVNYTFSAYIKTTGLTVSEGKKGAFIRVTDGENVYESEAIIENTAAREINTFANGWQRVYVTFPFDTAPEIPDTDEPDEMFGVNVDVSLVCDASAGTVWFSCPQVEVGEVANMFNLIMNADFAETVENTENSSLTRYYPANWEHLGEDLGTYAQTGVVFDRDINQMPANVHGNALRLYSQPRRSEIFTGQFIRAYGQAGDVFVLGGWANTNSVQGTYFRAKPSIRYRWSTDNGNSTNYFSDWQDAYFTPENGSWHHMTTTIVAPQRYRRIEIAPGYSYNTLTGMFTNFYLYRDLYGSSFTYDDNGNVVNVKDLSNQQSQAQYDDYNNLLSYVQPGSATTEKYTFTYGTTEEQKKKHLPLTATTPMGVKTATTYDDFGNAKENVIQPSADALLMKTETIYTDNGNYIVSRKDARGNIVTNTLDEDGNGRIEAVTDPAGNTIRYGYDESNRIESVIFEKEDPNDETNTIQYKNEYEYTNDRLTKISHNTVDNNCDVTYTFEYDELGRKKKVKVGNTTLSENIYSTDRRGLLDGMNFGNGARVRYAYDEFGRVTAIGLDDNHPEIDPQYEFVYDARGIASVIKDNVLMTETRVTSDLADRPSEIETKDENGNLLHKSQLNYDGKNRVKEFVDILPDSTHKTAYTYDADNRTTEVKYDNSDTHKVNYSYDQLNRITAKSNTNGVPYTTTYGFVDGDTANYGANATTSLIASITQGSGANAMNFAYTYDSRGNITSETRNGVMVTYEYDELNQLIRINDPNDITADETGTTWIYTYDKGGNILHKKAYKHTTTAVSTLINQRIYGYGDSNWKDKLTEFFGKTFTYDAIGNLVDDQNYQYAWEYGRRLKRISSNNDTVVEFKYDHNGLRTQKRSPIYGSTDVTNYTLCGKQISRMTKDYTDWNGNPQHEDLYFYYDAQGKPAQVLYNGTVYTYVHNLQGDIVGILDSDGTLVVEYKYDAWGNPLDSSGSMADTLGWYNPFRYRGYVWDDETWLYYVSSRYYNPETGRFINADIIVSTGQGILDSNMFAYCRNNPVRRKDVTGTAEEEIKKDESHPITLNEAKIHTGGNVGDGGFGGSIGGTGNSSANNSVGTIGNSGANNTTTQIGGGHGSIKHSAVIDRFIEALKKAGQYLKIYGNRSLKTAGLVGNQRPDIIAYRVDGRIEVWEFASPSQAMGTKGYQALEAKIRAMQTETKFVKGSFCKELQLLHIKYSGSYK